MADASLGTAVLRTRLDKSGLTTGLNQAKGETQRFARDSTTAIQGIGTAFAAVAASAGVRAYVRFLTSTAQLAQQADASTRLYEKSLGRTNQSLSDGAALVQRLSDRFGVANTVIQQSATLLLRQGASLDDIDRALTSAGASAAAAGFDISTAFDNVATAVATGRSELLETSGIVTNLGPVTQAYAKSIGKTVDELTQQEIIQARVNAIYKETASEIEDVDEILQGLPKSQANWTRELREAQEGVGAFTKQVLVPMVDAGTAVLRVFNDLPDPVKRAGTAMSGAAIGATALAAGIIAIRTALTGLSALGLLSFGPAGWIILGTTAVAGLVAVLTGRQNSLDAAVTNASKALASGDTESLTGALEEVIEKVDGPVKTTLVELQDELRETGDVGVDAAQRIGAALAEAVSAKVKAERFVIEAELAALRRARDDLQLNAGLQPVGDLPRLQAELRQVQFELQSAGADLGSADPERVRALAQREAELQTEIGMLKAAAEGTEGVNAALAEYNRQIAELETRLAGLPGTIPTTTPTPTPTPTGGGGRPGEVGLGPLAFGRVNPFGPLFQQYREHLDDELEREVLRFQRGLTGPRFPQAAGSVFGPVFTQYEDYLSTELEREVLRFQSGLLGPSLRFTPVSDNVLGPLATEYAEFLDGETERFLANAWDLVSQPARRAAADRVAFNEAATARVGGQAEFDRFMAATQALTPDAQAAAKAQRDLAQRTAEAERQTRAEVAAYESLARIRYSLNTATTQGLQAERELLELRKLAASTLGKPGEAPDFTEFRRELDARRARDDGGGRRFGEGPIVRQEDADRISDAARDFAGIVVTAAHGVQDIFTAIREGETDDAIRAGFKVFGDIGAAVLPAFAPFIKLGTELMGGLFASLFGGNRREEEERARAAELRRNQVSTLEFNFYFDQTNHFTGDLTSSANQGRLREAGIMSFQQFEQTLRRTILPRLDGLEAKVAAL